MFIQRAVIKNSRCLKQANVTFNDKLNVIVGNNECGKSTLLEAIHLALTFRDGRGAHVPSAGVRGR